MSESPTKKSGEATPRAKISDGSEEGGGQIVIQWMVRDGGSAKWPMLTRTNYADWALLMQVMLEARHLWTAISVGTTERDEDRQAMEALLHAVPPEMVSTLGAKATAKVAWDTIKTMRLGVSRVREAKKSTLRKQFELIKFNPGESIDDFGMRLSSLVTQREILGDKIEEGDMVRKFLSVVPKKYSQMACAIETLADLDTLSVEELIGRLKAAEERYELDQLEEAGDAGGKLLLTEEEWLARMKIRDGSGPSSGGNKGGRGKKPQRTNGGKGGGAPGGGDRVAADGNIPKDECRYCGKKGHWARECRKKKRAEAHLAREQDGDEEGGALLMAQVCALTEFSEEIVDAPVHLVEDRAQVNLGREGNAHEGVWYLDTGASNHMTGDRAALADLNNTVAGTVKFGDGSVVDIRGRGTVMFSCRNGEHRAITQVYYIPRLHSHIISMGQLDKHGCQAWRAADP
jgi:hypothetical protein